VASCKLKLNQFKTGNTLTRKLFFFGAKRQDFQKKIQQKQKRNKTDSCAVSA